MYYLRTRAAASAIQFTVDKKLQDEAKAANKAAAVTASSIKSALQVPSRSLMPRIDISSTPSSAGTYKTGLTVPTKSMLPMVDITNGFSKLSASTASSSTVSTPTASQDDGEITFEEAKKRAEEKELEQAQLLCSLENPGACTMCSG